MFLSIVIPTYNEQGRILKTLESIRNFLNAQDYNSEVIIVDDGSSDNTCQITKKFLWSKKVRPKLIANKTNYGKGYVVKQGMLTAQGDYVLFTDADNSTPIEEIDKLLKYIDRFEVIIGSRYLKKQSIKRKQNILRRIISQIGMLLIKLLIGLPVSDTQCGFKLFSNKASKEIFFQAAIKRWGFDIEILTIAYSLGYKIKEVPVNWYDDPKSRLRAGRDAIKTFIELVKIKTNLMKGRYQKSS